MLSDAKGFTHIYLCCNYTDMRKGIDGLIKTVTNTFGLDPAEPGSTSCSVVAVQTE
ncbi:MAG: transposase [bacterium LCO1.1]|uniref:Transposase n=1 Tax=Candidatus Weimeria bifida TaxID=2599074 RepID=A0A6N7IWU9_9FIRM|nr:transposase [Candidatus Weimeria bifida]